MRRFLFVSFRCLETNPHLLHNSLEHSEESEDCARRLRQENRAKNFEGVVVF
jgi:hypothetical protein